MKPSCPRLNERGRHCGGQLKLWYRNEDGSTRIYKCQNELCGFKWKAGPVFEHPAPEVSWLSRQIFKFRQFHEEQGGPPFVGTLKNLFSMFLDSLPSWPFGGGGTRSIAPISSGDDFEKLPPTEITIRSKESHKEPEPKPSMKEVLE